MKVFLFNSAYKNANSVFFVDGTLGFIMNGAEAAELKKLYVQDEKNGTNKAKLLLETSKRKTAIYTILNYDSKMFPPMNTDTVFPNFAITKLPTPIRPVKFVFMQKSINKDANPVCFQYQSKVYVFNHKLVKSILTIPLTNHPKIKAELAKLKNPNISEKILPSQYKGEIGIFPETKKANLKVEVVKKPRTNVKEVYIEDDISGKANYFEYEKTGYVVSQSTFNKFKKNHSLEDLEEFRESNSTSYTLEKAEQKLVINLASYKSKTVINFTKTQSNKSYGDDDNRIVQKNMLFTKNEGIKKIFIETQKMKDNLVYFKHDDDGFIITNQTYQTAKAQQKMGTIELDEWKKIRKGGNNIGNFKMKQFYKRHPNIDLSKIKNPSPFKK